MSSLDAFKAAMLSAKSVVHANPAATPSGGHLAKVWEQLGIADAIKGKLVFRQRARRRRRGDRQGRGRDRPLPGERDHPREGRDRGRPDPTTRRCSSTPFTARQF